MALRELEIRNAKPTDKAYQLKDDYGLYLEVRPTGRKFWRMRYWIATKESIYTIGEYPLVSMKEAREARDDARKLISAGIKPGQQDEDKPKATFADIAQEYFVKRKQETKSTKQVDAQASRVTRYALPYIGHMLPDEIEPTKLLEVVMNSDKNVTSAADTENSKVIDFNSAVKKRLSTFKEWLKDKGEGGGGALIDELTEQFSGNMNEWADSIVQMSTAGVIGERRVIITDRGAMFREITAILHRQVMPNMITSSILAAMKYAKTGKEPTREDLGINDAYTPAVQEQIDAVISKYTVKGDIVRAVMKGDSLSFANEGDKDFLTFKEYGNDVDYEPFSEAERYRDYVSFCKDESLKYECIGV